MSPKVSIGLPVYNGENYLREALDSILSQTFRDFEVVISDNASTDGTGMICREYAAKDPRVRYNRNDRNLGAARNYNLAFELSSGEYFKWAAHDDLLHPSFLARCVELLDEHPDVALCYTKTYKIDETGNINGTYDRDNEMVIDFIRPHERFGTFVLVAHFCLSVFGVFRRAILKRTNLIGGYHSSDLCLLAEVALLGRVARVPEFLFYRRDHAECSVLKHMDPGPRAAWFDPRKAGKRCYPYWRIGFEHFKTILRSPISLSERRLCFGKLLKWGIKRRLHLGREVHVCEVMDFIRRTLDSSEIGRKVLLARRRLFQKLF